MTFTTKKLTTEDTNNTEVGIRDLVLFFLSVAKRLGVLGGDN